jgi:hypothetical protein
VAKKGGDDAAAANAAQARSDEAARQASIRDGTSRINSLFDGTPYTPPASTKPVGFGDKLAGIGHNGGPALDAPATPNSFGGFTEDFYKGREKAYSDFATPQLEDQLAEARRQLTFSLDRSHLLDSSTRADQEGALAKAAGTARQGVADTALATGNQARTAVEGARSDLINTLSSTGDVQGAVNNSLSRATALSAPTQFSPLGSLFSNFTSGLGTQAAAEKAQYYSNGMIKAPFNTGLFTPSGSSSVQNTR